MLIRSIYSLNACFFRVIDDANNRDGDDHAVEVMDDDDAGDVEEVHVDGAGGADSSKLVRQPVKKGTRRTYYTKRRQCNSSQAEKTNIIPKGETEE